MGLFINHDHQPDVYKNQENVPSPNQGVVKYNSITELINEQQKANQELIKSISELKSRYEKQEVSQNGHWKQVQHQMNDLKISQYQRENFEDQLVKRLDILDGKSSQLQKQVESESALTESILEEINNLSETDKEISKRLKENEVSNQILSTQLNEQMDMHKEITNQLSQQEEHHVKVLRRLDEQEAITEKISRQLNHIRSIIFERTNHIAIKLEDGYKLTASHVYKLMHGTDEPLNFSLMNQRKEEQK